ncbi:MAG: translocation/assembly module TamB domain-containing protein [Prolixibacteraceae bacterium]
MIQKTIKTFLWLVLTFVFLFLLVAALIQLPAIQTKIVRYAGSYVSKKTNTKVELEKVSISFPNSIVIVGLYLEDTCQDTLLLAGRAEVDIALYELLKNRIRVRSFLLKDTKVNLHSTKTNPEFNYDFLTTAFADTSQELAIDTSNTSDWTFSIDKVQLRNVQLNYNDEFAGMKVWASITKSEFRVDVLNFEQSKYDIDQLFLDGLNCKVQQVETTTFQPLDSSSVMPILSAKKLLVQHSYISYIDSVGKLAVKIKIDEGELNEALIDLQNEQVNLGDIFLSKSRVTYHDFSAELLTDSSSQNNWIVVVKNLTLDDNSLLYKVGNKPEIKNEFDADHLEFNALDLKAADFYYSSKLTKVDIEKFNAIDQNDFVIANLVTDFSMDEHSLTTKDLHLNTPNTTIDADFYIQYVSLDQFTENYQFTDLKLDMRKVRFKNPDILYFKRDLNELPFFQNNRVSTSITGKVNGNMKHLSGKNLQLKTGKNTLLKTDFSSTDWSDLSIAVFDFPNLKLRTGKNDLNMIAGSYLPENIELPENIDLQVAFKGMLKSFTTAARLSSSYGGAELNATIDASEKFKLTASSSNFNLGSLLKDTLLYGPVSLSAEVVGQGLDPKKVQAKITAQATQLFLNHYNYQNISLDGVVDGQLFEGKLSMKDENAVFDFDGLVNLNPGQEQYQFQLDVQGINLQKLHLIEEDIRMSFVTHSNFTGTGLDNLNGTAEVNDINIVDDGKTYRLESVLLSAVNQAQRSEFKINSALADITYSGTISPAALPDVLMRFLNNYFPVIDSIPQSLIQTPSLFNFDIQLHNHPILSEVLFPELYEFIPGAITGSFDSEKNDLKLNASIHKMVYGALELKDFDLSLNSDDLNLNYSISGGETGTQQFSLTNLLIDGKASDHKIEASISSLDENLNKKLMVHAQISKVADNYKLTIDPVDIYLMNKRWNIAADNYIEFGKQGFLIHNLNLNNSESQINVASVNNRFEDDVNIGIKNFKLFVLSGIVAKDTSLVDGTINGNVLMKRVDSAYGLIADATITDLSIRNIPIGNLALKAVDALNERYTLNVDLSGAENNLSTTGYYIPNGGANSIQLKSVIESLSMKTIEAFSMGQITEASGMLSGGFLIGGDTNAPSITGELVFNNAFLKPTFLNNRIELKHEVLQLKNDGLYFNNFTLLDAKQHTAILNGVVNMQQFRKVNLAFNVTTKDFLLFNNRAKESPEFFGQMIIDSKIDVSGPLSLPIVKARLKMKKGSNFTFVVPEDQLTTDKGEDVVEFETGRTANSILNSAEKTVTQNSTLNGFDIAAIIEIDKEATLCLLMDPASTDSLVVRGEAALSFNMDQSGQMSLTGAYNLSEGSYMVSLESIVKKQFTIKSGSTILWNGDPLDADISISAEYMVRTSPYDLVADQLVGLSDTERGQYKQRYPFIVVLKLSGKILQPEISFEIQLSPEDKGIMGGTVNQKLSLLNEDPSALNKQVFALLVLGRFIQENPFQAEMGSASSLIRTTVGKYLSAQLNQLSSKVISGVELNFDIQSYDDYETGHAQGRTQVEIGMKKQLFNERLSVQLGGTVDVEGDKAKQNSASDIAGDVTVEYKLNKDGSWRLKAFRHNQYEGAIEGQLVETGAGMMYVKDFNRWKNIFRRKKRPTVSPQRGL